MGDLPDLLLALLVLAPASYLSTNLDNLLILSALLTRAGNRSAVITGYLACNLILLAVAAAAIAAGYLVPTKHLGLLGLLPIAFGVHMLFATATTPQTSTTPASTWTAVTSVFLVNSGDTLAVFTPLFAESEVLAAGGLAIGFALTALLVLCLALAVTKSQRLAALVSRLGPRIVPWTMIAVGLYVLADSTTDLV